MTDAEKEANRKYEYGYAKGWAEAVEKCYGIVKFHSTNYDGIWWALREIEKMINECEEFIDSEGVEE